MHNHFIAAPDREKDVSQHTSSSEQFKMVKVLHARVLSLGSKNHLHDSQFASSLFSRLQVRGKESNRTFEVSRTQKNHWMEEADPPVTF